MEVGIDRERDSLHIYDACCLRSSARFAILDYVTPLRPVRPSLYSRLTMTNCVNYRKRVRTTHAKSECFNSANTHRGQTAKTALTEPTSELVSAELATTH